MNELSRLLRSGDYAACRAQLDAIDGSSAALEIFRARFAIAERRLRDARLILERVSTQGAAATRAESSVLLAAVHCLSRDTVLAHRILDSVVDNDKSVTAELAREAIYYRALAYWTEYDNDHALETIEALTACPDPNMRARARFLQAWIFARRHDLAAHVVYLNNALSDLEKCTDEERDVPLESNVVQTLAVMCRELPLTKELERVAAHEQSITWHASIAGARFQIIRALAWRAALDGNETEAFRYLRRAGDIATSAPLGLLSLLDRAHLARAAGEGAYVEELIAQAVLRADSIDWPNVPSGERTALLLTAELVVEDDPQRAFAYLQTFEDAMQSVGTDLVYERDSRIRAFLLFSAGKTYKGLGDEAKARTLLIEAFSIFESFGYKWRAALAALALFELTGDRKWHQTAQIHASPYPNSWIAKSLRIDATLNEDDRLLLTETQREIYDALKEGLSNAEIAERLGRSSNTIRNHVRDIFRTLHVNSRVELLAKG